MDARWKSWTAGALSALLLLLFVGRTVRGLQPLWNWDVLGYMALALEWELDDPVEVHRATYAAAQEELEPRVFAGLISPTVEVRRERFRDPAAFTEHIAFYRARVLFTWLVHALHGAGAPLAWAVWWLSLASYVGLALVVLLWLWGRVPPWAALPGAALLAHAPPLLVTARFATSDGLATLLTVLGAYFLVERRRPRLGAALSTLAVLARPDAVLLVGALALCLWLAERRPDGKTPADPRLGVPFFAPWLLLTVGAYAAVQSHAREYGWWPVFHVSFLRKEVHPAALPTSPDWGVYADTLREQAAALTATGGYVGTANLVTGSTFALVFAGLAWLGLALARRRLGEPAVRRLAALLVALLGTYLVRWFLFPQPWDRFLAPLYVLVPLALVSLAAPAQKAENEVTPSITSS